MVAELGGKPQLYQVSSAENRNDTVLKKLRGLIKKDPHVESHSSDRGPVICLKKLLGIHVDATK